MADEEDKFDWTSDEDVLVPRQDAIAVYVNKMGDIVLRREMAWDEREDVHIIISRKYAQKIAERIIELAKEA